jgi:acyl-CoA hydrolase
VPDLNIADYLKPGDTVIIGQATAEPPGLVEKLIKAAQVIDGLTVLCGYTLSDAWKDVSPGKPRIKTYAAHGALRKLAAQGLVDVIPCHYSMLDDLITARRVPADVVLLQVAPPDADGFYDLGATVDHVSLAAEIARVVLVEVNENMPRTGSPRRLHQSQVTASVTSDRKLAGSPARPATDAERRIAQRVAALVPSGATVQLGASALAEAIAGELRGRRELRVRSGLVGDWVVDLDEAGALADAPGSCLTGIALGTDRLYRFLGAFDKVRMTTIDELTAAAALAECDPYVAVNSAVEVDLHGQVCSEVAGGRYVGAVGGQVDFFRAARRARSGLAVVALAATNAAGTVSRIIPAATGPVTTPQSDVDLVITEFGTADLRGSSYAERAWRLIDIAAPQHRGWLASKLPQWVGGHVDR